MKRYVQEAAHVSQQRCHVQNGHRHGPEAMRKEREQGRRRCAKKVDYQMAGIERGEGWRDERVEQLVGADHRERDRRHRSFGPATAPRRIACGNGQEGEKQRYSHRSRLSWRPLPVNRRQAIDETADGPFSIAGHS